MSALGGMLDRPVGRLPTTRGPSAWALIADGRLAEGLRLAQGGAHMLPESCVRIVLGLLALERQGRHGELVENRRKLREAHPALFARYMQDR